MANERKALKFLQAVPGDCKKSSEFIGVSVVRKRYRAMHGVKPHIGYFDSEEDAARAHDKHAIASR